VKVVLTLLRQHPVQSPPYPRLGRHAEAALSAGRATKDPPDYDLDPDPTQTNIF
jgi:hypothetical protein